MRRDKKGSNEKDDIEYSQGCETIEFSYIAGRKTNWSNHWGKVWQFLMKLTKPLPFDGSNSIPKYLHKRNVDIGPQKDWNMKVYIKFIHDGPKLETIQVPISQRTEVEHLYNRMGTAVKEKRQVCTKTQTLCRGKELRHKRLHAV